MPTLDTNSKSKIGRSRHRRTIKISLNLTVRLNSRACVKFVINICNWYPGAYAYISDYAERPLERNQLYSRSTGKIFFVQKNKRPARPYGSQNVRGCRFRAGYPKNSEEHVAEMKIVSESEWRRCSN